jgi:hypothetical protein
MHPPERPYTPMAESVTVAFGDEVADQVVDQVVDQLVDKETDPRSPYTHSAKWTIIPPKHADKDSSLKVVPLPPGTTRGYATTAVSQHTSKPTACTSNVPGINTTLSKTAQNLPCMLQQEFTT